MGIDAVPELCLPMVPINSPTHNDASARLDDAEAHESCTFCSGTGTHVFSRCTWCGGAGHRPRTVLRAQPECEKPYSTEDLRAPDLTRYETPDFVETPDAANADSVVFSEQKPPLQGVLLENLIPSNTRSETYYFPGSLPQYDFSAFSPSEPGQWYGWGFVPPNASSCHSPSHGISPKTQYLEDLGGTGRRPWRWH